MQQQQSIQAASQAKQRNAAKCRLSNHAQIELQTKMQLLQAEFELKNNLAKLS